MRIIRASVPALYARVGSLEVVLCSLFLVLRWGRVPKACRSDRGPIFDVSQGMHPRAAHEEQRTKHEAPLGCFPSCPPCSSWFTHLAGSSTEVLTTSATGKVGGLDDIRYGGRVRGRVRLVPT